jgi:lysozyme family protein
MAKYPIAIAYGLGNEGGYVNNPRDPGGETNYGICKRDHPTVDIKNLTVAQADEIYQTQYWCYDGIGVQDVATKLLDWAINLEGTGKAGAAIILMQRAIGVQFPGVLRLDGQYGPKTELTINRCEPQALLYDAIRFAIAHRHAIVENKPECAEFLAGWIRRDQKLPSVDVNAAAQGAHV